MEKTFRKKILISEQSMFGCWNFCEILFQPFQMCEKKLKEKKMIKFEIFLFEFFSPFYVFNNNDWIMFSCLLTVNYSKISSNYEHSARRMVLIAHFWESYKELKKTPMEWGYINFGSQNWNLDNSEKSNFWVKRKNTYLLQFNVEFILWLWRGTVTSTRIAQPIRNGMTHLQL